MTESPTGVASDGVVCDEHEHDGEVHEGDTEAAHAAAPLNQAEGGVYVELPEYFEDMYEQFP